MREPMTTPGAKAVLLTGEERNRTRSIVRRHPLHSTSTPRPTLQGPRTTHALMVWGRVLWLGGNVLAGRRRWTQALLLVRGVDEDLAQRLQRLLNHPTSEPLRAGHLRAN
jgi:hypothetical protein